MKLTKKVWPKRVREPRILSGGSPLFPLRHLFVTLAFFVPFWAFGQSHTFDSSNMGWGATGDPTSQTAAWLANGGNPGGYIRVTDAAVGGTWYFDAPADFTGNKCDAYGNFLHYDQFTSDTNNQQQYGGRPDVLLFGAGLTLAFDNAYNPGLSWTHYDVQLIETAGWRINDLNGPPATQAQMKAALANVAGLRIRGEYRSQDDFGGLDNVVLESSFRFDLDGNDDSGAFNGDFLSDTLCSPHGGILDGDAVLTAETAIDSIQVRILFATAFEQLFASGFPAAVAVQFSPNDHLTLINTGTATSIDFLSALHQMVYVDASPQPARDTRLIEFRVFTGCGEVSVVNAYLPVYPPPFAGENGDTTVCEGGGAFPLALALGGTPEPGGFWRPATSSPGVFDPARDAAGVFSYIIPPVGECPGDTAQVTVAVQPGFRLRSDTTICYDDTLTLSAPGGLANWQWSDGSRGLTLDVTSPGTFGLSGRLGECTFTDSVEIGFFSCRECIIYAPNAFSPNDDGRNDVFQLHVPCVVSRFRLEIFDRWGGLVFASDDPEDTWDGTIRGREQAPGVYLWRAQWEGELFGQPHVVRKSGDVVLIR